MPDLPSDPDDLQSSPVELPRLEPDSPDSCPKSMAEVVEYLQLEAYPDKPAAADLTFLRTADIEGADYWIWRFDDSDGKENYVTVSCRGRETTVGYDRNYDNLTPEQFMLATERRWI
jgi:hypothetical protein